jgi:hypothetical protein
MANLDKVSEDIMHWVANPFHKLNYRGQAINKMENALDIIIESDSNTRFAKDAENLLDKLIREAKRDTRVLGVDLLPRITSTASGFDSFKDECPEHSRALEKLL